MSNELVLENQVALITGGSRGIGRAVAVLFAQQGAKLVIVSRTSGEVKSAELQLRQMSAEVIGITADVSRPDDVRRIVRALTAAFGTVDILVNCAGVQQPIGAFVENDMDLWLKNININLGGTAMCCQAVLPIMLRKGRGKIINFSGGGATSPRPNFSAYGCSKAAVVRFTEILAAELKGRNIGVNAIAPGPVHTRMTQEIIEARDRSGQRELERAVEVSRKPPDPALPAELALFLASKASDGLTGRLISAVWDDWRNFDKHIDGISDSSLYTLRRIDGKIFVEK